MRGIIIILTLALVILLASWLFPAWWWIMLIPILFGIFFKGSVHRAFGLSFLGGLLSWGGLATYQYFNGSQLITQRVAELFSLPTGGVLLILLFLIGGLLAGLAAATGSSIHSFFGKPKRRSIDYY